MSEYIPFLVIGIFGALLFLGTILWTEWLFPENKKPRPRQRQEEFDFAKAKAERSELASSHG